MAYYENVHQHFGGSLILYQRDLKTAVPNSKSHRTPCWYMQLKFGGKHRKIDRSTKLTVYEDAYEFAKNEYLRLQQAIRLGHSLEELTFEQHWDDWFARNVRNGIWADGRQRWHQLYANRYFKSYFRHADGRSMLLNEISQQVASGYWDWRIAYLRTLRCRKALPSKGAIAICASRLQKAGEQMRAKRRYRQLGMRFIEMSDKCRAFVNEQSVEFELAD